MLVCGYEVALNVVEHRMGAAGKDVEWHDLDTVQRAVEVAHMWDDEGVELRRHQRIALRDANEVLHATASGLIGSAAQGEDALGFDAFPSGRYVERALISAFWCYLQTLSLL